jgi:hypothetical protein
LPPPTFHINRTHGARAKGLDLADSETLVFCIPLTLTISYVGLEPEQNLHPREGTFTSVGEGTFVSVSGGARANSRGGALAS